MNLPFIKPKQLRQSKVKLPNNDEPSKLDDGKTIVKPPTKLVVYETTSMEQKLFTKLVNNCYKHFKSEESEAFLLQMPVLCAQFLGDTQLYKAIQNFKYGWRFSDLGVLKIKGLIKVDQAVLDATPLDYHEEDYTKTRWYRFANVLLHGLLGTHPMVWMYQRPGIVHSVIQRPGMEKTQTGSGTELFHKHSEDVCLLSATDFVTFCFLRNFEKTESAFSSIRSIEDLDQKWYFPILFDQNFNYPADANYKIQPVFEGGGILYGNRQYPKVRFDPIEMMKPIASHTPLQLQAMQAFSDDLEKVKITDVPEEGDVYFLNNKLALHYRGEVNPGVTPSGEPCHRRWMMRTMSVESYGFVQEFAHPENPRLVIEKGMGQLFTDAEVLQKAVTVSNKM